MTDHQQQQQSKGRIGLHITHTKLEGYTAIGLAPTIKLQL